MQRDYKFYLALDNSLCLEYITEKFFVMSHYNVVPIVFDLHENFKRLAPTKSYINALDFASVKDLADYLKLLDTNDDLYSQYFEWKNYFSVHSWKDPASLYRGLCRLCSILHEPQDPASIYRNLTKWWLSDATCKVLEFPLSKEDPNGSHFWKAKDLSIT